jgi:AcrR family transcriptional regulator
MSADESKKNRILEFSFKMFSTMGVPHVTMDDISRGIGIGKGTLYKFFPSKETLLFATIHFVASNIEKQIEEIIANEQLTAVEKLNLVLKSVGERISKIKPAVITSVERSMPEAYEKIIELREHIVFNNMLKIFEEGKQTGLFDPNMDSYLVINILVGAVNHITDERVLSTIDYSLDNLLKNITSTILYGCLTEEGKKQTRDKVV